MRRALLLTGVISTLCVAACSPPAETQKTQKLETPKPETGTAQAFDTAAMDRLLSEAVESGDHVGVSGLVFDEGQVVYTGAFGLRDKERGKPVELDTVFRIYSMTKPVTTAIIMDLQEEGLLDINDPASKYIPELAAMQVASVGENGLPKFTPQETPMTLKDLILHRSGMGYGIFGPVNPVEDFYGKAELFETSEDLSVKMTKLSGLPLLSQPGQGWYYSYSIDVLGRIAEVVTGKRLGDIMDERIFDPLGMDETGFSVRPDLKHRFASTYLLANDGTYSLAEDGQESPFLNDNAFQSGGGGLVSTLGDYAKFAQMLLDGGTYNGHRVLDEATVKAMMTNQMDPDDKFLMPWFGGAEPDAGFGYGGRVVTSTTPEKIAKRGQMPGQFGWSGAARTLFWVDKPNEAFGIIMLQYFGQKDPKIRDEFKALAVEQTRNTP